MQIASKVRTCLWFEARGEEAAELYVSLLPDSFIERVTRPAPEAPALVVELSLCGAPFMILNGGPHYVLSPAASISVMTADQAETDRLWQALLADGGRAEQCGWLVDRFGLSWQIVPEMLPRMLGSEDLEAAARAREAMLSMQKIEIAELEAAFGR